MPQKLFLSNKDHPWPILRYRIMDELLFIRSPWVIVGIYAPICLFFCYYSLFELNLNFLTFLGVFVIAIPFWTFIEYIGHRFVFHLKTKNNFLKLMVYIVHAAHHDYPNDDRLMHGSPILSLPLAALFYGLFYLILGSVWANPFFAGFMFIYIIYEWNHYAVHKYNFKNGFFQFLKKHHLRHHFKDNSRDFGFTTGFWDRLWKTNL